MRPSRPCLRVRCPRRAWLLGLLLLVGLSACGPAPSDQAPGLEPRASLGGPSESHNVLENSPSVRNGPVTQAASPAPFAAPLASNPVPAPDQQETPAPLPEQLVLPQWIAQALASPEVPIRLRALDLWGQQAPTGSVDPLLLALEDEDERVQARALELIEQDWARGEQATKVEAEQ